jgi:hypothetical protein
VCARRLPFLACRWRRRPACRTSSSSPRRSDFLSLYHRSKSVSKFLLSFLGTAFGLYKPSRAPLRIHLILLKLLWSPRDRSPRAGALAAASPSRATSLSHPRLRFDLG